MEKGPNGQAWGGGEVRGLLGEEETAAVSDVDSSEEAQLEPQPPSVNTAFEAGKGLMVRNPNQKV